VLSVQVARAQAGSTPLVMRRWRVPTGGCASFWPLTGAPRRCHQSSLGYEPYDARFRRLGLSLAGAVTSADRTDPSRSVGFVSPVSGCLAASGFQIGLQTIDLRFPTLIPHPGGCCPRAVAATFRLAERPRNLPGLDTADARRTAPDQPTPEEISVLEREDQPIAEEADRIPCLQEQDQSGQVRPLTSR
jgi:hypothetical protein